MRASDAPPAMQGETEPHALRSDQSEPRARAAAAERAGASAPRESRPAPRGRRRIYAWARRSAAACAVLYPLALITTILTFRLVGERWWFSALAIYLPRVVLLTPVLVLVPLLWLLRLRRLLWLQLLAAGLVLFPLMGLQLHVPSSAAATAPSLRILSMNVNSCWGGFDQLATFALRASPDIVMFQEMCHQPAELIALLQPHYRVVRTDDQFLLASRYDVDEVTVPERFEFEGRQRTARYVRYRLATPLGPIALFNLHPLSPRETFYAARGNLGFRRELWSGRFFQGAAEPTTLQNNQLRELQLKAAGAAADRERIPVVLGGDTNLPGLHPVLSRHLGAYRDGFASAGFGFGYTYPRRLPFMRLDRIFASQELRFTSFHTTCDQVTDHCSVLAELTPEE